jgi:hypothetical protein
MAKKFNTPPKERLGSINTGFTAQYVSEATAPAITEEVIDDPITRIKLQIDDILTRLRQVEISVADDDQMKFPNLNFGTVKAQGSLQFGNLADIGEGFSGLRIDYPAYDDGTTEWLLSGVNNDAVVAGIDTTGGGYFSQGTIGGWSLAYEQLTADSGNAFLTSGSSSGSPAIGLGATGFGTGTGCWFGKDTDGKYKAFIGDAAGHHITWNGSIFEVVGSITATTGTIGGFTIGEHSLTAGADEYTVGMQSGGSDDWAFYAGASNPASAPFRASKYGSVVCNNLTATGAIKSAVFVYGEVQGTAGTLGVFKSAGKALAFDLSDTTTYIIIEDINGHVQLFEVDDILRVKTGVYDAWLKVTEVTDETTYFVYTVDYCYGSTSGVIPDGTAVIDYGQAGDGYIILTADDTNAPYMSVMGHSGSPWSDSFEYNRQGNLNGFLDYSTDAYGLGTGDSNNFMSYDPTNKLRLRFGQYGINASEAGLDLPALASDDPAYIAGRVTYCPNLKRSLFVGSYE